MKQPRLPFIKLMSKIVRFPKAEVDAYLAQTFQIKANGQGRNKQDCEGSVAQIRTFLSPHRLAA